MVQGSGTVNERPSLRAARPRHRRRTVWLIITILVFGVVGSFGTFVARYRPIDTRGGGTGVLSLSGVEEQGSPGEHVARYKPGALWGFLFPVDSGRLGVTITGVKLEDVGVARAVALLMEPKDRCCILSQAVHFHSFALRPYETRQLILLYLFPDCGPPEASMVGEAVKSSIVVSYRIFGVPRQIRIPLESRLAVTGMPQPCSQRLTPRGVGVSRG